MTAKRKPQTPRARELAARKRRAKVAAKRPIAKVAPRKAAKPAARSSSKVKAAPAARGRPAAPSEKLLPFHPLADVFPLIEGDEFEALVADIAAHGQRQKIVMLDGKILDGRNRYRACLAAKVKPRFEPYAGSDPVGFVVSCNLRRRHLDSSQRAIAAAKLATLVRGRRGKGVAGLSAAQAAELLNVSTRSVGAATVVRNKGAAELRAEVEAGRLPVSVAATLAELPADRQAEVVAQGEREIIAAAKAIRARKSEARRQERVGRIREIAQGGAPLTSVAEKFPVIYADPPWRYEFPKMGDTDRSIENHYPTMSLDEICALPVGDLATPDAVLFLWITVPLTYHVWPRVGEAWGGFEFRSEICWDKVRTATGWWTRNRHEKLLIATRGKMPLPARADVPESLFARERGEHSAKPDLFYPLIEKMYPDLPRIELFARQTRLGWSAWGNQAAQKDRAA
jgi:N6-adenosine-specific RNA methylase IME4